MDYAHQQLLNEWIQKNRVERPTYSYETSSRASGVPVFRCKAMFLQQWFGLHNDSPWYPRKDEAKRAVDLSMWEFITVNYPTQALVVQPSKPLSPSPIEPSPAPVRQSARPTQSTPPAIGTRVLYVDFDNGVVENEDTLYKLGKYFHQVICVVARNSTRLAAVRNWTAQAEAKSAALPPPSAKFTEVTVSSVTKNAADYWIMRKIGGLETSARVLKQLAPFNMSPIYEIGILSRDNFAFTVQDIYKTDPEGDQLPITVTMYCTTQDVFDLVDVL